MQTIGRRYHGNPEPVAFCDLCGVPWPESKLKRGTDGWRRCPVHTGKTAAELELETSGARPPREELKVRG